MNSEDFKNYSQGAKYIIQSVTEMAAGVAFIAMLIYIAKHGKEIVETLGYMIAQAITIQI